MTAPLKPVKLSLTANPENLKKVRQLITTTAENLKLNEKTTAGIILAVDEVCSNIIRHGYKGDDSCNISVSVSTETSPFRLVIEIQDTGKSFNLEKAKPRDVKEVKPGGLGVYIVKQVMDDVQYKTSDDGTNHIKLIKNL